MKSLWTLEEFGISLRLNYELDNEANKNHFCSEAVLVDD